MAWASTNCRRGIHAHGILLWVLAGGAGELQPWKPFWLACDVSVRRIARAFAGVDSVWRERAIALDAEREDRSGFGVVASAGYAVQPNLETAHHLEFVVHAGFDLRSVGRNGLCSDRGYGTG